MGETPPNRLGAYMAPRWSSDPVPEDVLGLRFEVVREGVALGPDQDIALDKGPFTVVGRQPDICHYTLLHPSISRQHAVVQHGPQGAVFLYDLGSTHGTRLNKAPVPAGQFVPLRVGDVVQFGLSTRLHCVEGPERLRPPEWQSLYGPLAPRKTLPVPVPAEPPQRDGSDSDAADDDDDEDEVPDLDQYLVQGTMQHSTLSQKQQRFVADLDRKRSRLAHILKEASTLQNKESVNGSLTSGQQNQLTQCMRQMAVLQAEVDEQTEELIQRLLEKRKSKRRSERPETGRSNVKRSRYVDSDEEDEFYNRTLSETKSTEKKPVKKRAVVETYDSLKRKLTLLNARDHEIGKQMKRLQPNEADSGSAGQDSLEQFMSGISQTSTTQQLAELMRQKTEIQTERIQLEKLIKIVTPAGSHLITSREFTSSDSIS